MIFINKNFNDSVIANATKDLMDPGLTKNRNTNYAMSDLASRFIPVDGDVGSTLVPKIDYHGIVTDGYMHNRAGMADAVIFTAAALQAEADARQTFGAAMVSENFVKTLDKVYTKLWAESVQETGFYDHWYYTTIFTGLYKKNTTTDLVSVVDRLITAGILLEADRLTYEDIFTLTDSMGAGVSLYCDLAEGEVQLTCPNPVTIDSLIKRNEPTDYLYGKKMYLMLCPLTGINKSMEAISVNGGNFDDINLSKTYDDSLTPYTRFKAKEDSETSKYGEYQNMGTQMFFEIGDTSDKAIAELEGKPLPDLVLDHTDRISHLDNFQVKIKYGTLTF